MHLNFLTLLIYVLTVVSIFFLVLAYVKIIQIRRISSNMNYFQQITLRQLPNEHIISEPVSRLENGGLTSAIIDSLPAIQYRDEIRKGNGHGSADCAVCLGEFSRGEWLRLLPNCAHVFHVSCIDTWFRSHSTCPLCRKNVLYDLNSCTSSVSLVALLETARREDPKRERPLHYRLLELGILQNQEFMLGMMSGRLFDTNPNGSVAGMVSPVAGSPNDRQTVQNQLEQAHSEVRLQHNSRDKPT